MSVYNKPDVYALKHSDSERAKSQSGGAFALFSDLILNKGGVVYGCVFNDSFEAVHSRAETKEQRDAMRYSKYVQSNMLDTYSNVYKDLELGRRVLFSGTSCQVAGLKGYLQYKGSKFTERLICIDIVCHGVPSPRVWRDYLDWEKKKTKNQIKHVLCRNKELYGWKSHWVTINFENGNEISSRMNPKIFYGHNILRPACYKCPYKDIIHPGDITIADYWGIDEACPGFKDEKGVSLVLINNVVGAKLFDHCKHSVIYAQTKIENSMQTPLCEPYEKPKTREKFWMDYKSKPFSYIAYWYGEGGILPKLKRKVRRLVKMLKGELIKGS